MSLVLSYTIYHDYFFQLFYVKSCVRVQLPSFVRRRFLSKWIGDSAKLKDMVRYHDEYNSDMHFSGGRG